MELAQLICERSSRLAEAGNSHDVGRAAVSLVRTAHHDTTMLEHASVIFRTRLRTDPADQASKDGLRLLTRVIAFLR